MSEKTEKDAIEPTEFNFKHRLTGAAVLIFFGVLVLPWLLGPPGEVATSTDAQAAKSNALKDELEAEVAKVSSFEADDEPETVYVSKITPLDAQEASKSATKQQSGVNEKVVEEVVTKEKSELVTATTSNTSNSQSGSEKTSTKPSVGKQTSNVETKQAAELPATQVASAASQSSKSKSTEIDVGWVVQVGLFTDKNRAENFKKQLAAKGFGAKSSIVDTNKGKGTGTRVWLGPYARQVAASRERDRLKSVAGQDGFVRRYPFTSR